MRLSIILCLFAVGFFNSTQIFAHGLDDGNEAEDLSIELLAPVQATDGKTLTVLGLTLAIPVEAGDDNSRSRKQGADDPPGGTTTVPTFAVGQWVKIEFASDALPLVAREIKDLGAYVQTIKIHAPLQALDTTAKTVQLLTLTIDVSQAAVSGGSDDATQSVAANLSNLAVGQLIEVVLDQSKLPALISTSIEVKNLTNKVDIHVEDEHGVEIENLGDDMSIDLTQSMRVKDASTGRRVKKAVRFSTVTNTGSLTLGGLLPGRGKLVYTFHGKSKSKTIKIDRDGTAALTIKLNRRQR